MKDISLNKDIKIDLAKLIDSRLLIQANSGGGKSWLLRRILEQSQNKVQQIIIDLEGEFSTLREKYDYVLAGKGGDTPATPQTAAILARRVLELNASIIIDLYELPHRERKAFVRIFLDSMINAPKELWHPVMVVIDEAHVFAPEKGESEALEAVIDLATRGRKRGYCVVLATQRISKLHKDAAAECNNKLIGRTGLDIDMKRASDELGFTTKDQQHSLRKLEAGEFFAFGPAISDEIIKLQVGEVQTSHPKAGSRSLTEVIPPTEKIKKILGKLADLPAEAQQEAKTVAELKIQVRELTHKLGSKIIQNQPIPPALQLKTVDRAVREAVFQKENEWKMKYNPLEKLFKGLMQKTKTINILTNQILDNEKIQVTTSPINPSIFYSKSPGDQIREFSKYENEKDNEKIDARASVTGGALRMLKVLVSRYPIKLSKSQLATFSKLSPNSGTFGTYLSTLKTNNFILIEGDLFQASQEGIDFIGEAPNPPQTTDQVISMWKENLSGGSRRMFDYLVENHPVAITKDQLGQATALSATSGTFGTYLSILRSNGLIKVVGSEISLSDSLFI